MSDVKFPYTAWVLTPSFKPVQKTFINESRVWTNVGQWHDDDSFKSYHIKEINQSKEDAIAWGREDIEKQQAAINKKQQNLDKRRAALDKAAQQ